MCVGGLPRNMVGSCAGGSRAVQGWCKIKDFSETQHTCGQMRGTCRSSQVRSSSVVVSQSLSCVVVRFRLAFLLLAAYWSPM